MKNPASPEHRVPTPAELARQVLRQDPDIIRAEDALSMANTGHRVLTTMMSYSVPEALARLSRLIGHGPRPVLNEKTVQRLVTAVHKHRHADISAGQAFEALQHMAPLKNSAEYRSLEDALIAWADGTLADESVICLLSHAEVKGAA